MTLPRSVRVFAPAKINLFLHVTRKRADGYHDLESLVAFADVGDVLSIGPAESGFSLQLEGPFAQSLSAVDDNLVLRAAHRFSAQSNASRGAKFSLRKELPVASGIGGGSADAAATLRGLSSLWGIPQNGALSALAAEIGSDVPVCLRSETAWMEGRGERVTRLPDLPGLAVVLVNPGISISTADVFRRLILSQEVPHNRPNAAFASLDELLGYLANTRNDLEMPAQGIAPVVAEVLAALRHENAAFVRMSGSGATCFGLFASAGLAARAAQALARTNSKWWVRATNFISAEKAEPVVQ